MKLVICEDKPYFRQLADGISVGGVDEIYFCSIPISDVDSHRDDGLVSVRKWRGGQWILLNGATDIESEIDNAPIIGEGDIVLLDCLWEEGGVTEKKRKRIIDAAVNNGAKIAVYTGFSVEEANKLSYDILKQTREQHAKGRCLPGYAWFDNTKPKNSYEKIARVVLSKPI